MSKIWYEDPKTGDVYQDRPQGGRAVRYFRDDLRQSSTSKDQASSRRRDSEASSSRPRRDSVINRASADDRPSSKQQAQRGTSTKRGTSVRPDEAGKQIERREPGPYGGQGTELIDSQATYAQTQAYPSRRASDKHYYQDGGYNPPSQTSAPSLVARPADDLVRDMQSLSLGDRYFDLPAQSPPEAGVSYSNTAVYQPLEPAVTDLPPTSSIPAPGASQETLMGERQVKGTPGEREQLDKSYQVRKKDYKTFFRVGRVFATLWTEGVGQYIDEKDKTFISEVIYKGERVHSKIRRFVVVREGDRSVSCLPVTSYNGYGHQKRNIRLNEHGHIYSKGTPQVISGMLSRPLRVKLSRGVEARDLTEPSLVNYGKVYTVETNVKVKDVGELDPDSRRTLKHYFRKVYIGDDKDPIPDSPAHSSATLAYVGGAASTLPPTSPYTASASAVEYPPALMYPNPADQRYRSGTDGPTGYTIQRPSLNRGYAQNATSDMRVPQADYQALPGSAYSTEPRYQSTLTYGQPDDHAEYDVQRKGEDQIPSTSARGQIFNSTAQYYHSQISNDTSTTPYDHTRSGGDSAGASAHQTVESTPRWFSSPREEEIKLTTIEEQVERRRQESKTGLTRDRDLYRNRRRHH